MGGDNVAVVLGLLGALSVAAATVAVAGAVGSAVGVATATVAVPLGEVETAADADANPLELALKRPLVVTDGLELGEGAPVAEAGPDTEAGGDIDGESVATPPVALAQPLALRGGEADGDARAEGEEEGEELARTLAVVVCVERPLPLTAPVLPVAAAVAVREFALEPLGAALGEPATDADPRRGVAVPHSEGAPEAETDVVTAPVAVAATPVGVTAAESLAAREAEPAEVGDSTPLALADGSCCEGDDEPLTFGEGDVDMQAVGEAVARAEGRGEAHAVAEAVTGTDGVDEDDAGGVAVGVTGSEPEADAQREADGDAESGGERADDADTRDVAEYPSLAVAAPLRVDVAGVDGLARRDNDADCEADEQRVGAAPVAERQALTVATVPDGESAALRVGAIDGEANAEADKAALELAAPEGELPLLALAVGGSVGSAEVV